MEERRPKPRQKYPQARYEVNQSPLYGLHSKRRLAKLLLLTLPDMLHILRAPDTHLYRTAPIFKKGLPVLTKDGQQRLAEVPKPLLSRVHQRVLNLLSRIRVPNYIHGSIKRRSYVTNAATHLALGNVITLDLKRETSSTAQRLGTACLRPNCARFLLACADSEQLRPPSRLAPDGDRQSS